MVRRVTAGGNIREPEKSPEGVIVQTIYIERMGCSQIQTAHPEFLTFLSKTL
jgi:hypothetical protein